MGRAMKDSGVEWIGEIPADWTTLRIKQMVDYSVPDSYIDGDWIESPYIQKDGIRYLTTGNIGDGIYKEQGDGFISEDTFKLLNCKYAYPGDLIISRLNAPYGRSCILPDLFPKYVLAVDNVIFRPLKTCLKKYICYVTQCSGYQNSVLDNAKGTTMKRISRTNLANIVLPLPPTHKQHQIIGVLDEKCACIDSTIAQTRTSIEEYKHLKQAVITQAVTKGVRGDRPMKESGIEWIKQLPNNWTVIPSKFLFRNSDERRLPEDEQLTASQKHGIITQTQYMELENAKVVFANKGLDGWKHVEPNDFVISLRSFQGGLEMSEITGCITWHYIVLRSCKPICPYYFKWLFKSSLYINALQSTCNFIRDGQDLRYSNFVQIPLFTPPLTEQQEIAAYLDEKCAEIDALIGKKEQLLAELEKYKKSLIYEYVTGKKEVPLNVH